MFLQPTSGEIWNKAVHQMISLHELVLGMLRIPLVQENIHKVKLANDLISIIVNKLILLHYSEIL